VFETQNRGVRIKMPVTTMPVNKLYSSGGLRVFGGALAVALACFLGQTQVLASETPSDRSALFGDLHVHTINSFDSYSVGVRATPDDAYRFAKGEAIQHAMGYPVRLRGGPLDFYAVTDHAEYLGVLRALGNPDHPLADNPLARDLRSVENQQAAILSGHVGSIVMGAAPENPGLPEESQLIRTAWQENIAAAERNNEPGKFTTFIGYEYTSTPGGEMLHRNIIFSGSKAADLPFGAAESVNPEDLWDWLDLQREQGIEAMSIPHNSNWSLGTMFEATNKAGEPIDAAYAQQRERNEPLVEITQIKGTSETHPQLSPNDEWADFEIVRSEFGPFMEGGAEAALARGPAGEYVRDALQLGMKIEQKLGVNPYRLGFVGATDAHNAASPIEEDHYFGKLGSIDGTPQTRDSLPGPQHVATMDEPFVPIQWSAAGLTGVWAAQNSRASIYEAFRRRETFATSGPRMTVRLFAGYDYPESIVDDPELVTLAYAGGVPMGGELAPAKAQAAPKFLVWALRDHNETWLERAQIVKGWIEDGESREQVYDVACADGVAPNAQSHRCPTTHAKVDLNDCSVSVATGSVELKALWQDPDFDATEPAFYYLRVLQNPTCRWSTWDALRAGASPRDDVPATLQERAWSSPIWYRPS
jgi:hypothetical protein